MTMPLPRRFLARCLLLPLACTARGVTPKAAQRSGAPGVLQARADAPRRSSGSPFFDRLVAAAIERTSHSVRYDPTYFRIGYPGGDVAAEVGVCSDEVIRSYRAVGVDLQKEVHGDMQRAFDAYPRRWGLTSTDTNIDHRRVPNLMVFFERHGAKLPVTRDAADYKPGDLVTWSMPGNLPHIGIVVDVVSEDDDGRMQIVHNVGAGPTMEDVLFEWPITGHYRYSGPKTNETRP